MVQKGQVRIIQVVVAQIKLVIREVARMASAITGGKASAVDYHILKDECKK